MFLNLCSGQHCTLFKYCLISASHPLVPSSLSKRHIAGLISPSHSHVYATLYPSTFEHSPCPLPRKLTPCCGLSSKKEPSTHAVLHELKPLPINVAAKKASPFWRKRRGTRNVFGGYLQHVSGKSLQLVSGIFSARFRESCSVFSRVSATCFLGSRPSSVFWGYPQRRPGVVSRFFFGRQFGPRSAF